jgi:hypothetical protein
VAGSGVDLGLRLLKHETDAPPPSNADVQNV